MLDSLARNGMPTGARGISRRGFFKGVALALAGGALLATREYVPGIARVLQSSLAPLVLGRSLFAKHVGETFQIERESAGAVAVQLTRIGDLPAQTSGNLNTAQEYCFSLLFRGPTSSPLAQGTYRFEHSQIGSFGVFIVPMAPSQGAQYYEAIFNCPPA